MPAHVKERLRARPHRRLMLRDDLELEQKERGQRLVWNWKNNVEGISSRIIGRQVKRKIPRRSRNNQHAKEKIAESFAPDQDYKSPFLSICIWLYHCALKSNERTAEYDPRNRTQARQSTRKWPSYEACSTPSKISHRAMRSRIEL